MPIKESPIALAERHVAEGERRIARQRTLIVRLERDKHATTAEYARKILVVLHRACGWRAFISSSSARTTAARRRSPERAAERHPGLAAT